MLITPVQHHNSLNSIPLNRQPSAPPSPKDQHSKLTDTATQQKKTPDPIRKKIKPLENGQSPIKDGQSFARKKAYLEMKLQEKMRKNAEQKLSTIPEQQEDIMHRKEMLADILQEYQQISKDKIVLTTEIKNMKKYLLDIRSKLDQSLLVLNKNTTLFAMMNALSGHNAESTRYRAKAKRPKKPKKLVVKAKGLKRTSFCEVKKTSTRETCLRSVC